MGYGARTQERVTRVTIPYTPRPQFVPFHERKQRWGALVMHRRAGKTVASVTDLIRAALTCRHPHGRYAYAAPFYSQAKDVAWGYVKQFTAPIPDIEINESELRVDLPNGSRVRLYGMDKYDRLRGIGLDGIVLDEYGDADPRAWSEVIRPALSDRKGWAVFIGTPKGRNHFHDLWRQAVERDDWYTLTLKASETGILDAAELEDARRSMSTDQYNQEYECSFEAAVVGSYYGTLLQEAKAEGRIRPLPREPALQVHTAWDLGIGDSTAIWFYQQSGREVRLIDYYEASGVGLEHYAKVLQDRGHVYGWHSLPHDVEVTELGTGRSRLETLAGLGIINVRVIPRLAVDDGINAVRTLLPRCWFDPDKCQRGIDALSMYRREWDEKLKAFKLRPYHDWSSHCFAGETEVLTRYGTHRIMDLPATGEVLTPCGWKAYRNPRITLRNAQLVEVAFSDGHTVRCTPDHLFLTVNGWKSASRLRRGSRIQSSLTRSRSISTAAYTACGRLSAICRAVASGCISTFGGLPSVQFQRAVISTIGTTTRLTMPCPTWNACRLPSIFPILGERATPDARSISPLMPGELRQTGTDPKRGGYGTSAMLSAPRVGRNGSARTGLASIAALCFQRLSEKVGMRPSSAATTAKPLTIASVKPLELRADVWDLTVPDGECFSLVNGAVVHNSSDAFRYLAIGIEDSPALKERRRYERYGRTRSTSWMGA